MSMTESNKFFTIMENLKQEIQFQSEISGRAGLIKKSALTYLYHVDIPLYIN